MRHIGIIIHHKLNYFDNKMYQKEIQIQHIKAVSRVDAMCLGAQANFLYRFNGCASTLRYFTEHSIDTRRLLRYQQHGGVGYACFLMIHRLYACIGAALRVANYAITFLPAVLLGVLGGLYTAYQFKSSTNQNFASCMQEDIEQIANAVDLRVLQQIEQDIPVLSTRLLEDISNQIQVAWAIPQDQNLAPMIVYGAEAAWYVARVLPCALYHVLSIKLFLSLTIEIISAVLTMFYYLACDRQSLNRTLIEDQGIFIAKVAASELLANIGHFVANHDKKFDSFSKQHVDFVTGRILDAANVRGRVCSNPRLLHLATTATCVFMHAYHMVILLAHFFLYEQKYQKENPRLEQLAS